MSRWAWLFLSGLLVVPACGEEEECVRVEVDLGAYEVPSQIDTLHFEINDDDGLFVERSYPLAADVLPPSLTLCPGTRCTSSMMLVVYAACQGEWVTQSEPQPLAQHGSDKPLKIVLP